MLAVPMYLLFEGGLVMARLMYPPAAESAGKRTA
jgi:Sec-independent protein secretion pathway component TatC